MPLKFQHLCWSGLGPSVNQLQR